MKMNSKIKRFSFLITTMAIASFVDAAPVARSVTSVDQKSLTTDSGVDPKLTISNTEIGSDYGSSVNLSAEKATMDMTDVIKTTLKQIPDCIDYQVRALVVRCVPTYYGCHYIYTLKVRHNSPDLFFMTHEEARTTPWREYNAAAGIITSTVGARVMGFVSKALSAPVLFNVNGGKYLDAKGFGDLSNRFYEATVIGHIGVIVMKMIAGSKENQPGLTDISEGEALNPDPVEDDTPLVATGQSFLHTLIGYAQSIIKSGQALAETLINTDYAEGATNYKEMGQSFVNFFKTADWTKEFKFLFNFDVNNLKKIDEWGNKATEAASLWFAGTGGNFSKEMIGSISEYASSVGYTNNKSYLCPVGDTKAFMPYYLSTFDALQWRMGYPLNDFYHTPEIFNPLDNNRVGRQSLGDTSSLADLADVETWGYIYPREGTVNAYDSYKVAAVVASRAASILFDKGKGNVHIRGMIDSGVGVAGWSNNFPVPSECHRNIANTVGSNQEVGNYAWTAWNDYTCYLNTNGFVILEIPVDIQITKRIPE